GAEVLRGLHGARPALRRGHRLRWHRRRGLGMRGFLLTQGTVGLVGEVCKRLRLLGALTPRYDGLGWCSLCCRASAGPGYVQHDTQPQEAQDCQLVEKKCGSMAQPPRSVVKRGDYT